MILLLSSIYEDDNGIESPDTLPTTKTFLLYSVLNLVYVPLLSPDSLRHAVSCASIRNTATNSDDCKLLTVVVLASITSDRDILLSVMIEG